MNLRIIVQGSSDRDYARRQWGLAILVDDDVLFDTFADPKTLADYFHSSRIDVSRIKHIVISHDHWDHTGGLPWLLEQNHMATVYVCAGVSDDLKTSIVQKGNKLVEVMAPLVIREDVCTTGELQGRYSGRPIVEQSLVVRQGKGVALVTGCSHPGILHILSRVSRLHDRDIDLVLGGLHLMGASEMELRKIAVMCGDVYRVNVLAPFHCTGSEAIRFLEKNLPHTLTGVDSGDLFTWRDERSGWELIRSGQRG